MSLVAWLTFHVCCTPQPDFHSAMDGKIGKPFYDKFVADMRRDYKPGRIKEGVFGAMMAVELVNDGCVSPIFATRHEFLRVSCAGL
jgi:D-Tyr-tRNAtyr deacylase